MEPNVCFRFNALLSLQTEVEASAAAEVVATPRFAPTVSERELHAELQQARQHAERQDLTATLEFPAL